jgi:hypothetical protein
MFADLGFKVDGGGAAYCDMVHQGATVDVVDRGCFDLPVPAWICLETTCECLWFSRHLELPYVGSKTYVRHNIGPE